MRIIEKVRNNAGQLVSFTSFADEYYTFHKPAWTNYFDKAKTNLVALAGVKIETTNLCGFHTTASRRLLKLRPIKFLQLFLSLTGPYVNTLTNLPFRKEIETVFNYSTYRQSAKASWHAERFELKACLYCNAQFALAIGKDGKKKKLVFQLDHFYSKSSLSISFPFTWQFNSFLFYL